MNIGVKLTIYNKDNNQVLYNNEDFDGKDNLGGIALIPSRNFDAIIVNGFFRMRFANAFKTESEDKEVKDE